MKRLLLFFYERDRTIFAGSIKNRNACLLPFLSTKREDQAFANGTARLVLPAAWVRSATLTWPSKRTREKYSLSGIQSARSWLRALLAESMTKHENDEAIRFSYLLDLASCTQIIGMGIAMECTHLHKYTSQYVWMMLSHSIVAPRYPWGMKNKSLMRSVLDPFSSYEGAGTQTRSQQESALTFLNDKYLVVAHLYIW